MEEKIQVLNQLGHNIVFINKVYYAFTVFEPADNNVHKHYVEGKDITNLLTTEQVNIQVKDADRQVDVISTKLENLKTYRREYSKDFSWITYLTK